jgi:hypothetical protein
MRCLVLLMLATAVVSAVGILQSLGLGGVSGLLAKYYTPVGLDPTLSAGRGGSLLGLPAAVADLATLNLAIAIAMIVRGYPRRKWLVGLAILYALSVVAAAEFSTVIGLAIAVAVLMLLTKSGRIAAYSIPVTLVGAVLLWPVIRIRLQGFQSPTGLPFSWVDRLDNLHTYFWPILFSDNNWILGVRPAARVITPAVAGGFTWIESGYTWLLWGGGIPLLASYLAFAGIVIRKGWAYSQRVDPAGIAATAVTAAMCSQAILMILDPHLTYRASGDAIFLVLALVRSLPARSAQARRESQPAAITVRQLEEVPA